MSDRASEPRTAPAGDDEVPSIEALTDDVLPALVARLRASRLGELEVRADGWRVRLRRAPGPGGTRVATVSPGGQADGPDPAADSQGSVARSPAVGYFSPAADLGVGRSVQVGDSLGSVDVLGIRQDVAAPVDGVITRVLVDRDQAVEFGQVLANIDPSGMDLGSDDAGVRGQAGDDAAS